MAVAEPVAPGTATIRLDCADDGGGLGKGGTATLSVDGAAPGGPPPPPAGVFQFTVTLPVGKTHFAVVNYGFPPGTPPGASYDTRVTGSFGPTFNGPHVTSGGLLTQNIEFEVV